MQVWARAWCLYALCEERESRVLHLADSRLKAWDSRRKPAARTGIAVRDREVVPTYSAEKQKGFHMGQGAFWGEGNEMLQFE